MPVSAEQYGVHLYDDEYHHLVIVVLELVYAHHGASGYCVRDALVSGVPIPETVP